MLTCDLGQGVARGQEQRCFGGCVLLTVCFCNDMWEPTLQEGRCFKHTYTHASTRKHMRVGVRMLYSPVALAQKTCSQVGNRNLHLADVHSSHTVYICSCKDSVVKVGGDVFVS